MTTEITPPTDRWTTEPHPRNTDRKHDGGWVILPPANDPEAPHPLGLFPYTLPRPDGRLAYGCTEQTSAQYAAAYANDRLDHEDEA